MQSSFTPTCIFNLGFVEVGVGRFLQTQTRCNETEGLKFCSFCH